MFELRHLRVFCEVSRRGSLSAAAESLDYTQPAVSQQMAALERRAMMPLLDRTTRGVRLTEAGEALLRHAEAILSEQTLAEQELEALAAGHGGRVRMASFPTAGAALVPPAVSQFIARYPDVELSVLEAEPQEAVSMLRAGELELALVAERKRPDAFGSAYEGIVLDHLLDEPMCVLLPQSHPLARRRHLRLEDVGKDPWIELSRSPAGPRGRVYLAPGGEVDSKPRVAFRSDDFNVVQGMVAAGAGVALVPELALGNLRRDVIVHTLGASGPMRNVAAATLAGVHRSPATVAMLELLAEVSGRHDAPQGLSQATRG